MKAETREREIIEDAKAEGMEIGRREGMKEGREIGRREGIKEGQMIGMKEGRREAINELMGYLMSTLKLTEEQAMEALKITKEEWEEYKSEA